MCVEVVVAVVGQHESGYNIGLSVFSLGWGVFHKQRGSHALKGREAVSSACL